jgi:CBS domain containing-hemolysin-like protein
LVLCILSAAALAIAEVAVIRVRRSQVVAGAAAGDSRSRALLRLLDDLPIVVNSV